MTAYILVFLGCWFIASGTLGRAILAGGQPDWFVTTAGRLAILVGGLFLATGWYA